VDAFTVGGGAITGNNVTIESRLNVDASGNPQYRIYNGSTVAPAYGTVTLAGAALAAGAAGGTISVYNSPTMDTGVGAGTVVNATNHVVVRSVSFERAQTDGLSV